VDIYEHISQMKPFIASNDWEHLEHAYRTLAAQLAGAQQAARIAALDFASYQSRLSPFVVDAVMGAEVLKARAVYFEYDLDNLWQSGFFLCGEYKSESADDEDWACDWIEDFGGPDFPEASKIYLENGFDRTTAAKGSTLYLVARTVAAFGRCVVHSAPPGLTVCIAFHDQVPIMRIAEAT
jgi:hypothetical protein